MRGKYQYYPKNNKKEKVKSILASLVNVLSTACCISDWKLLMPLLIMQTYFCWHYL